MHGETVKLVIVDF